MSSVVLKVIQEAAAFRFRPKFSHLILHVTNVCNFRCSHCFVDFGQKAPDLTLDEFRAIARQMGDLIWLDIGGGEPFLREDLYEIVGLFRAREISIPTNGWFADKVLSQLDRIERRIGTEKLILTFSIDGMPAEHDLIRNKPGSFERLRHCYFEVKKKFPRLRSKVNTVLCDRNIHQIIPLMQMVKKDLDPAFHSILFLRGSPLNRDYKLPSAQEILSLEARIFSIQQTYLYGRKGLTSLVQKNYQSIKRDLASRIIDQKTQVIPCLGGRAHLVIYADGEVAPCELLPAVGSLRKEPLRSIVSGPAWKSALEGIARKCCYCTHDCNMIENILYRFDLYPRLAFEHLWHKAEIQPGEARCSGGHADGIC